MALARRHELPPLKEPQYEMEDVPRADSSGKGSATIRISDRQLWLDNLAEMILLSNRAGEEYERKIMSTGEVLIHPGKPLSLEYVADRLDTDDPIWGWTVRSVEEGWLQGYICVTTFTTWQRWFRWDTLSEAASILPYDAIPEELDESMSSEEIRTKKWWDSRIIDGDGRLARALNRQIRDGDWTDEGVVWPRIAEISLLGGLGCGGLLLDAVIEELSQMRDKYDYICVQATENAVPFYESRGFVRVGAIARYEQKVSGSEGKQSEPIVMERKEPTDKKRRRRKKESDSEDEESQEEEDELVITGTTSPFFWYTTVAGDTPGKIAKKHPGVRSSDITFLNRRLYRGMSENSTFIPGTKIRVPKVHPVDVTFGSTVPFRIAAEEAKHLFVNDAKEGGLSTNGHWYISNNGETLKKISQRFHINCDMLVNFNRARYETLRDNSTLHEGTILLLPGIPLDLSQIYSLRRENEENGKDEENDQQNQHFSGIEVRMSSPPPPPIPSPPPSSKILTRDGSNLMKKKLNKMKNNNRTELFARSQEVYTKDPEEKARRLAEIQLHKEELNDPDLREFYLTEKCDDVSVVEGLQTKQLSEVMAYRHWTFPDDPAALTTPSYMMILSLNDKYLKENVPSMKKNASALDIVEKLSKVDFCDPPFNYCDADEEETNGVDVEIPVNTLPEVAAPNNPLVSKTPTPQQQLQEQLPPPQTPPSMTHPPPVNEMDSILGSPPPPPSSTPPPLPSPSSSSMVIMAENYQSTPMKPKPMISAGPITLQVYLRSNVIKSWRQGPLDGLHGEKIFISGADRTKPGLVAFLENPLKPRPPLPPKRPLSNYFEFCNMVRPEITERNPGLIPVEITRLCSEAWKTASLEQRVQCKSIADENHRIYAIQAQQYKRNLLKFHLEYGLDEDLYDLSHADGPRLRKNRLLDSVKKKKEKKKENNQDTSSIATSKPAEIIQNMITDIKSLSANQRKLFNKIVVLRPKPNAVQRMHWLSKRDGTFMEVPPMVDTMVVKLENGENDVKMEDVGENTLVLPPPPPPPPPPIVQYYFILTYIPDLQWCRLAPVQQAGIFEAGMSKKKGFERHVGRTRWVLAPESVGREIDVSAERCIPVPKAYPVKNVSDADKEEWDILDEATYLANKKKRKEEKEEVT